jgi:very-short-patch-repair endonuclease
VVDEVVVRGLVTPTALARRAVELRNSKRPGCNKVLHALALQHPDLECARNTWEAEVLRLIDVYELPRPRVNLAVVVGGARRVLDVAWAEQMVDLEFDGFLPHARRDTFDDDRVRQNALVAAGWTVFRVTSRMLCEQPDVLFRSIREALASRGHEIGRHRLIS